MYKLCHNAVDQKKKKNSTQISIFQLYRIKQKIKTSTFEFQMQILKLDYSNESFKNIIVYWAA